MKPKTVNLIQVNAAVLLWGGTAMFAKGIALPVGQITCIRALLCAAVLLPFGLALRKDLRVKRPGHYGVMIVLGLLLVAHWLTYFQSLKVSSAAVAIMAMSTYPVFTTLLEPFFFGEKLRKIDIALALVVFVGVFIMTPSMSLSNATTQGIVLGVGSGLFFMTRNLITRKYAKVYSSFTLMFWQGLIGGAVLVPMLFMDTESVNYSPRNIGLLVLLGVIFTTLPHTLYSACFKNLSAKTVGILGMMLPFYGAFMGYFVHSETVAPRTAVGGLLILACVICETARSVKG